VAQLRSELSPSLISPGQVLAFDTGNEWGERNPGRHSPVC